MSALQEDIMTPQMYMFFITKHQNKEAKLYASKIYRDFKNPSSVIDRTNKNSVRVEKS